MCVSDREDMTDVSHKLLLCLFPPCTVANHPRASGKAGTDSKSVFDVRSAESQETELLLSDTACV